MTKTPALAMIPANVFPSIFLMEIHTTPHKIMAMMSINNLFPPTAPQISTFAPSKTFKKIPP
ncbi:hypothetical protein D3C74_102240 [compost metagenome]